MGTATLEDIKTINKRWLGNPDVELPTDGNICYAVPFNKDRNAISTQVFADLIDRTHPSSHEKTAFIPNHSIIIESSIKKGDVRASDTFHSWVYDFLW